MKAIQWKKYGPPEVFQVVDIVKPTPKDDEILIKVRATTASQGDSEIRSLDFPFWLRVPMRIYIGVLKPREGMIPGMYLAGDVEAAGKDVTKFKVGDAVFTSTSFGFGAYAEYKCRNEKGTIALKPPAISYEEACVIPMGSFDALQFLRRANIQPGQRVLINGAGGSIGTVAIQIAKHFGAEVTAVDSARKLDALLAIGADHVVDYTQADFSADGAQYDVVFDVICKRSFWRGIRSLKAGGMYLLANPRIWSVFLGRWVRRLTSKNVDYKFASETPEDLTYIIKLVEGGTIKMLLDENRFTLDEIVAAHRYVESGKKIGNVIIDVA